MITCSQAALNHAFKQLNTVFFRMRPCKQQHFLAICDRKSGVQGRLHFDFFLTQAVYSTPVKIRLRKSFTQAASTPPARFPSLLMRHSQQRFLRQCRRTASASPPALVAANVRIGPVQATFASRPSGPAGAVSSAPSIRTGITVANSRDKPAIAQIFISGLGGDSSFKGNHHSRPVQT